MVERLHGMQEVSGSIPLTSTRFEKRPNYYQLGLFYLMPISEIELAIAGIGKTD